MNDSFMEKNWNEEGKKIAVSMANFGKSMKDLNKKIEYVKNQDLIQDEDINTIVEKVESELENAKTNIEPLIDQIKEKTSNYACDFQLAANQELKKEEEEQGQDLLVMDLENDKEMLQKRRKDLEIIHKTSKQIKEITDKMNTDLLEQGELLNDAEEKVGEAEENADKANENIEEANKLSKSNTKCMIFYIVIIVVALAGIGLLVWGIIKWTKNKKTEPAKTEPAKTEPSKTEPSKTEPSKTEPSQTDPSKTDPSKTVSPIDSTKTVPAK